MPDGRLINCGRHALPPPASSLGSSLDIVLHALLSTGLCVDRLPQVWRAESPLRARVARIYDPLYILDDLRADDMFFHIDAVVHVESDAYKRPEDLQGNLISQFFGCFTTTVLLLSPRGQTCPRRSHISAPRSLDSGVSVHGNTLSCDMHKATVLHAVAVAQYEMRRRRIFHRDLMERDIILKDLLPSSEPYCESSLCVLRYQVPTTLSPSTTEAWDRQ
ncbi:hypothetical protein C8J57DRAFT_1561262 [Mycena rebaudengoi]|nr:hypothetical protein C8J57DRAFT_1561262 [Mycena rebaudengoi]